jgi:hypothetical protein
MSYDTVADIWGQTSQPEDKHDAFVAFMSSNSSDGPLRVAEYDKMICEALLAAFGKLFFFLESSFINHSKQRRPVLAQRPSQGP